MNLRQALTLYTCHALTTWSARSYEFAAILFTAAAFPHGLRAASIVGIANSIAAILFGSLIGRWIDHGQSRLRSLMATIFINKGALVSACIFWQFIIQEKARPADDREAEIQGEHSASTLTGTPKTIVFGLILLLGLIESLSRKANLISMERDWVPLLAPPTATEGRTLTHVNAMMGRIDMVCKMLAPPLVSQILVFISPKVAALLFTFAYSISFYAEFTMAERLYKMSEQLQEPKGKSGVSSLNGYQQQRFEPRKTRTWAAVYGYGVDYVNSIREYFQTEVWAPSLAMCITHGSILSLTGVTLVFFLASGYSLQLIVIAEIVSAVCELASTFATPFAVRKLTQRAQTENGNEEDVPLNSLGNQRDSSDAINTSPKVDAVNYALAHTGLYGISWMLAILLPAVTFIFYFTSELRYPMARYSDNRSPTFTNYPIPSILLLGTLALSRLGRGVFSLTTQQMGQSRVAPEFRSTFAGVEVSFVSILGLSHNMGTAVFSDPRDFSVLAVASWMSLLCSMLLYVWWMRREGILWLWRHGRNKTIYQEVDHGG